MNKHYILFNFMYILLYPVSAIKRFFIKTVRTDAIKNILLVRHDGIGDFITFIPTIKYIMKNINGAKIVLWVENKNLESLIKKEGLADKVVVYQSPLKKTGSIIELISLFGINEFDLVIFSRKQKGVIFQILGFIWSKHWIAGFTNRYMMSMFNINLNNSYHNEMMCNIYGAKNIAGADVDFHDKDLWYIKSDFGIPINSIKKEDKVLIIHPGGKRPSRHWNTDNYKFLADNLNAGIRDLKVVFIGDEKDKKLMKGIEFQDKYIDLMGKLSIDETFQLISMADAYVGNDSGFAHYAYMKGIYTVVIFGPGDIGKWVPPIKIGYNYNFFSGHADCKPCYLSECNDKKCFKDINKNSVAELIIKYLGTL